MCSGSELKRIQTTAPALWEDSALPGLYFLCNILFHPENGSEIKRQQEISSRLGNLIMQNIIKFFLSFSVVFPACDQCCKRIGRARSLKGNAPFPHS